MRKLRSLYILLFILSSCQPKKQASSTHLFDKENLLAWCIVPFDATGRSPEERADMLDELGISQFAYDYRDEHLPSFVEEISVLAAHRIELRAVWFWVQGGSEGLLDSSNEFILESLKNTDTRTELWVSFPAAYYDGSTDGENLQKAIGSSGKFCGERKKSVVHWHCITTADGLGNPKTRYGPSKP